ncbi:unnamed protein product [Ectocarpus sp. CCAP 1310/34]|nr:unnamed protein product [Ectocarpus sp. CCAP 1310/34]
MRFPDDEGFTHLRADRLGRAVIFVAALRQGEKPLPLALVRDFSPSKDCLCQRPDCFLAIFAKKERKAEFRQCSKCKYRKSDRSRVRWYPMDAAGDHVAEGTAIVSDGDWWCGCCYHSRLNGMKRDDKPTEQPANRSCGSEDEAPTLVEPLSTVRRMVDDVLGRGEILCWQDVAGWLAAERAKVGMEEITRKYARQLVLNLFTGMDADPGSKSRLVRADGAQGDARERELFLVPNTLGDKHLVDLMLRARRSAPAQPPSNQLADKGGSLESILKEVEKDTEDADARMSVVRAAGRIVRADVESDPALKNTTGTREKYRYADELDMKVKPPRETLLSTFPPSLVGLYQSMTDMALYREIIASETEHPGEPWVWQTEGRDGRHPTTSGDLEGENGDGEKKNEARHINSLNRDRRSTHRRLLVMCTVVVTAILRGRYMGSHDIKGAQWAKSKGTCREVTNFVAEHGLWATTSQIQHREDYHARFVEDKDLLSQDAECAAIPLDNCDFDPRVGVGQGEGPHLPFIAATALTVGPDVGRMDDWWLVKGRGSLTVEDVLMGPERDRGDGARRYNEFSADLYRGVFAEARNNSDRAAADTCFECELRKSRPPHCSCG